VNKRRIKILQLLADGYSPKEIADLLHQPRSIIFKEHLFGAVVVPLMLSIDMQSRAVSA
jgi:hypothetical protein